MRPRGGPPRPSKAAGPVFASAVALAAWAAVAHNSGSGWVQALGGLLAGFVVAGLVGPAFATARIGVTVVANPSDATAGAPVAIELALSAPARVQAVVPEGPITTIGSGDGPVEVVPARRGPIGAVTLTVGSGAPFGLLWWRKRVVVPLARPMWVAPVAGPPDPAMLEGSAAGDAVEQRARTDGALGEPRGVRPYAAGDPRRHVHWPATAHRGELMVREAERPEAAVPEVRVVLPDDGPDGDAVAERAMGTLLVLLARSPGVMLGTIERDGPRHEAVYTPADAGRRLARAMPAGGPRR